MFEAFIVLCALDMTPSAYNCSTIKYFDYLETEQECVAVISEHLNNPNFRYQTPPDTYIYNVGCIDFLELSEADESI